MKFFSNTGSGPRILVLGAGIIGLSVARRLSEFGCEVAIYDPSSESVKASWAAAGMISARFEALIEPEFSQSMLDFADFSAQIWPEYSDRLEQESGQRLYFSSGPSLALIPVAFVEHQKFLLERLNAVKLKDGKAFAGLSLNGHERILFPNDGQVDNRAVLKALHNNCMDLFVLDMPDTSGFDVVVETMGWKTPGLRPVKGQMVSLEKRDHHPDCPVRWGAAYIVPKHDRTIIGATVEPDERELTTDDDQLNDLLERAIDVCPSLARDLQVKQKWAGLRPMSDRQTPVIGWNADNKTYVASGHYRNGILLAPATAELAAADILNLDHPKRDCLTYFKPGISS